MEQWLPAKQAPFFSSSGRQPVPSRRQSGNSCLKVLALIIIALLLFATGWLYQAGTSLERTVFNHDYYQDFFQEAGIASLLHEAFMQEMSPGTTPGEPGAEMNPEEVLEEALSEEWMEAQLLAAIDDFLAVLDGEQETLTAIVDFREPKAQLMQSPEPEIQAFAAEMPDEFSLQELIGADPRTWHEFQEVATQIRQVRNTLMIVSYTSFFFLFLFSLFLAGIAGAFKWCGTTVFFSGLTFAGLLQLGSISLGGVFTAGDMQEIDNLVNHLFSYMLPVSLIFAGVGLFLLITGLVLGKLLAYRK